MQTSIWRGFSLILCAVALGQPAITLGQEDLFSGLKPNVLGGPGAGSKNPVSVEAEFTAAAGGKSGELRVTAKIAKGWHIYSMTQPKGGPIATKIKLAPGPFKATGDFKASPAPKSHIDQEAWPGLKIEEPDRRRPRSKSPAR
jgi:hypothetical protein